MLRQRLRRQPEEMSLGAIISGPISNSGFGWAFLGLGFGVWFGISVWVWPWDVKASICRFCGLLGSGPPCGVLPGKPPLPDRFGLAR